MTAVPASGPRSTVWSLRLAGLGALVNGGGFGAFDIPATWHLGHDHEVWYADGNPTYGNGPFESHGISVTVPVLLAFFGSCLLLAIGGVLLLVPRTTGVVVTLAGIVACAPFWWGFDLPFAWFSVAGILILLVMAGIAAVVDAWPGFTPRDESGPGQQPHSPAAPQTGVGADDPMAVRRAGWAGAAAVVVLVAGITLCSTAGVDAPATSDAAILERLHDSARQAAAGLGLPLLGVGVALLLWFATGLRRVLDRLSGSDPLGHAIVPATALLGGLVITGVSLDVSSAITALATDASTADADSARVLGTAGLVVALTGLTGGATLVAATARIAHQVRAVPSWAVWASYLVAVLCLSGYWSAGTASVALLVWLVGAVVGVLRWSAHPDRTDASGARRAGDGALT